jgi:hypothetical protein
MKILTAVMLISHFPVWLAMLGLAGMAVAGNAGERQRFSKPHSREFSRLMRQHSLVHNLYDRALKLAPHRQNPNLGGTIDVITTELYDQLTVNVATAFPSPSILFQTPKGQGGKTLANTNMTAAGILPNPDRFTIWAIAAHISNNSVPSDFQNLLSNVTLELYINNKWWSQGPLVAYPAGRGYKVDSVANVGTVPAGSAPVFSVTNGVQDPRAVSLLDASITIEQGEQFSVVLTAQTGFNTSANNTNPAGNGVTLTIYLIGNRERGTS